MAKINITVDTTEKTVAVDVDGKKLPDIHEAHVYTEAGGFFGVDVVTVEEHNDLRTVTRLVASEDDPTKLKTSIISVADYQEFIKLANRPDVKSESIAEFTPDFIAGLSNALGQS